MSETTHNESRSGGKSRRARRRQTRQRRDVPAAATNHDPTHMKNTLLILGIASLLATGLSTPAQTNTVTTTNPVTITTNAPTIAGALTELYDALSTSGLASATNYAVEPYVTYAPDAPSGNRVGGGAFIAYNLSKFVAPGLEVDYLGQFSLVSATLTLQAPTHPFTFLGGGWTNVAVVPMAIGGLGKALSGGPDGAIAVTDAGGYVQFGECWGGKFNVGAAYGRWDNAGAYSGPRYHFFVGWSKGF